MGRLNLPTAIPERGQGWVTTEIPTRAPVSSEAMSVDSDDEEEEGEVKGA